MIVPLFPGDKKPLKFPGFLGDQQLLLARAIKGFVSPLKAKTQRQDINLLGARFAITFSATAQIRFNKTRQAVPPIFFVLSNAYIFG
ncbi:hypothetical protein BGS_0893 [Beggiatoa sp. SS]|nr:hypothetical protein BGS_0893 [Beggiatoa sp. SS]